MDATLQIIIRAQARQAQAAVQGVTNQVNNLNRAAGKVNSTKFMGFFDELAGNKLIKAGKNLQWVGRQLVYNFTLPLGLAGVALFKFTQSVERELTHLRKVYGDASEDQAMLRKETDALAQSFKLLSSYYGVHQAEVAKIGSLWAQAGSAGRGLAENTKATIEAMILGDMEAEKATEALIGIQAVWRLSTQKNKEGVSELQTALAQLNIIENQTGIGFEGLIDVYQRAGGSARTAGMQFAELGALAAALVPATGSAAQAGNSLRTIMSRLQSPTRDMIEALERMGIVVTDPSWLGATATQKLELVAERFTNLSTANQNFVSSILASRWQVSRFSVLMQDISSGTGYYAKALAAVSDEQNVLNTYNRELQTVLQSSPKRWDIMTNTMRNALADAFIPLLPAIFEVMRAVTQLATAFSNLSPETQKWILFGLAAVAIVGPILVMIASFTELIGVIYVVTKVLTFGLLKAIGQVAMAMGSLVIAVIPPLIKALGLLTLAFLRLSIVIMVTTMRALISLYAFLGSTLLPAFTVAGTTISVSLLGALLAIAAAVGIFMLFMDDDFRGGFVDMVQGIGEALWRLPQVIVDVFNAVIRVLGQAMTEVVDLLSYLNPFARHSPSLVDSVRAGVSTILDEYSRLTQITPLIQNSINALNDFGMANSGLRAGRRENELREKANQPGVVGGNQIVDSILSLESQMPALTMEIRNQELVVARWERSLQEADATLEALENQLASSQSQLDSVTDAINAAYAEIDRLASTPIAGMGEMEDQIFANEMAAKALQLELLGFERAGISIDSITEKYAAMNGEIELLRGEQSNLRAAGAGSDILKVYDDQIAAIEAQRTEMGGVEQQIRDIEAQLDSLDLERRFLELTRSITFDPLVRQIEQMVNGVAEMDFDTLVNAIREQQRIIAELLPQQEELTRRVEQETAAVDAARAARDGIAAQLDVEQQKLDALNAAYQGINDLIREMEALLDEVSTAASIEVVTSDKSFVDTMFDAGLGVDYEQEGIGDILGREGTLEDIEAFNKEMEDALADMLQDMGIGDLFAPIREKWDQFGGWLNTWWGKIKTWFTNGINWIRENWMLVAGILTLPFTWFFAALGAIFALAGPPIYHALMDYIINPLVGGFMDYFVNPIVTAAGWVWTQVQMVWETIGAPVIATIVGAFMVLPGFFATVWGGIVGAITGAWEIISGIFTAIWEAVDGYLVPLFEMFVVLHQITWALIVLAIEGAWALIRIVWDAIVWFVRNVLGPVFDWLLGIITTVWDAIGTAVQWTWKHIIEPVFNEIDDVIHWVVGPAFEWLRDGATAAFSALGSALTWIWEHTIAPIFEGFRDVFENHIAPAFQWLYNNVIRPTMGAIASVFGTAWGVIASAIEGGVNFFIGAFNRLADAVNAVAGLLGIGNSVSHMDPISLPRIGGGADFSEADKMMSNGFQKSGGGSGGTYAMMAAGGVIGKAGDVVSGLRAIVGEGSNIHPEYVIPTDPRYRSRAQDLYGQLGRQIGGDGLGDIAGGAFSKAKGALGKVGGLLRKGAVAAIWDPVKSVVGGMVNQIPTEFFRSAGHGVLNMVDQWMRGTHVAYEEAVRNQVGQAPNDGAGSWRVIPPYLDQMGVDYKILSTHRPGATTRFTGQPSWHGLDRAIDLSGPSGMINYNSKDLLEINHAIYQGFKPWLKELIYGGVGAKNVFRGQDHKFSNALLGEHINHVHASLARGGFVVPRRPGGAVLRVGEGAFDERVQVMPLNHNDRGGGGDTYNFYGDLSFPNITDGDDAQEFVANLKAMA